ncbi:HAMP domain-containing sensor histidine kinase [uncultured Draconibacterium sp.]|uniref:sensor histidine kinase n=1 Tax=uncultured Draconibacterium sp. TaxID=1573823 RepID=UPI0032604F70
MQKIKFEYRITLLYLLIGGAWILFSDKFLLTITSDNELLTNFQTYKGWFYVATTSLLLFLLLKRHLKRLRKAEAEAKKSNELKTAFLQNISHEIRTPMNSIVGFSDILNTNTLDEKQTRHFLAIIRNSSNQLLYIVNQLLDISMLETGNVSVYNNSVRLNQLIDEISSAFNPLLKKDIELIINKGLTDKNDSIICDEGKLRQVLMNLLNNANKFTTSGTIRLSYKQEKNLLKFFIEDTGIGISEKAREFIFTRFNKENHDSLHVSDGVGLGLAICKGNIDLMQGDIGFSSTPGEGSVFYFHIPYTPASK